MRYILKTIIKIIIVITKRNVLLIPIVSSKYLNATKSKFGFWYCGNLYNSSDIAYGIARNGLVEQEETFLVQNILKQLPDDFTLLDIGANTGYYGIMSSYMFPNSEAYSFEPLKSHCEVIKESAYLNRLSNIDINEYALGEDEEERDIHMAGSGTTFIQTFTQNTHEKISMSIKKLDNVVKSKNIKNIKFIKIDVEGFEFEVIKGAKNTIELFKPVLFVEICHTKDGRDGLFKNDNFNKTIDLIEQFGYKTQILENDKLRDFNNREIPKKGVWMFLFTHKKNHKDIDL
jgi:FkbM family methyltransferase